MPIHKRHDQLPLQACIQSFTFSFHIKHGSLFVCLVVSELEEVFHLHFLLAYRAKIVTHGEFVTIEEKIPLTITSLRPRQVHYLLLELLKLALVS